MKEMYINGRFTPSESSETMPILNPATEEVLDSVPNGNEADAHKAVAAAHTAFQSWRQVSGLERCEMLHEAAHKMKTQAAELAEVLTLEEGKPIPESDEEVEWLTTTFDYYAGLGVIQDISVR